MFTRWCVTFEEIDNYGNQGIGNDVVTAETIEDALKVVSQDLEATFSVNSDQITSWRVIGIQLMPERLGCLH